MRHRVLVATALVLSATLVSGSAVSQQRPDLSSQRPGEHECQAALAAAREKIELQQQLIEKLKERIQELEKEVSKQ